MDKNELISQHEPDNGGGKWVQPLAPWARFAAGLCAALIVGALDGTANIANAAAAAESAASPPASQETMKLEEIVVEARRRQENLQNVITANGT